MRLECEDGRTVDNPTAEVLERALRSLRLPDNGFLILEDRPGFYMQVARNEDGNFSLEYQDGSLSRHFESAAYLVDVMDVIDAFTSYLSGDNRWKQLGWRRIQTPGHHA